MTFPAVLHETWESSWRPPRKYKPDEWAEQNYTLPPKNNSEPGKFRFSRTPYLRGIVNAIVEPGVEEVVFLKPTRVGGTTAGEIMMGYWIDNDPGPCLSVYPTESDVEDELKTRIRPMLESCESLRAHMSENREDNTLSLIQLDTMPLYFGWGGSPGSLARRTCRYVRMDEVDKYPMFSGREADPLSLAGDRTTTYGYRRRHYITSTPTTQDGAIWMAWLACGDRRHYFVPCPHCGVYQRLVWPQVKWPKLEIDDKVRFADRIEQERLAWYECQHCKARIEDHHKPESLERGDWVSEGQSIRPDRTIEGDRPRTKRVGMHLSSIYSPWMTFAELAAQFIRARGDVGKVMHFRNSTAQRSPLRGGSRQQSIVEH